jgi:hypothetical protein
MGLFNRRPRDLAEIAAREQERDAGARAYKARKHAESEAKHARKGLNKTAKTLGLTGVQERDPATVDLDGVFGVPVASNILSAAEGNLLIDGQQVPVQLLATARIRYSQAITKNFQYRTIDVYVVGNHALLGQVRFDTNNNGLDNNHESYSAVGSYGEGKGDFLATLHTRLQNSLRQPEPEIAAASKASAPALSELEIAAPPAAPAAHDTSLEL